MANAPKPKHTVHTSLKSVNKAGALFSLAGIDLPPQMSVLLGAIAQMSNQTPEAAGALLATQMSQITSELHGSLTDPKIARSQEGLLIKALLSGNITPEQQLALGDLATTALLTEV